MEVCLDATLELRDQQTTGGLDPLRTKAGTSTSVSPQAQARLGLTRRIQRGSDDNGVVFGTRYGGAALRPAEARDER